MKTKYILDTSVLVHDPSVFSAFSQKEFILPITVIEELDKLKKFPNEVGKNARICIRKLDTWCIEDTDLQNGLNIENDNLLKIDISKITSEFGEAGYGDNQILACAYNIKKSFPNDEVILLSRDFNLRLRARAFGIKAKDHHKDKTNKAEDIYNGFKEIVSQKLGDDLELNHQVNIEDYSELKELLPNEFVHIVNSDGDGLNIGRRVGDKIKTINSRTPWGLSAANLGQAFAIDMLMDPKVPLITMIGAAGTGKSLISVACALEMTIEKKVYDKLIIYKPIASVGADIGFLPGSLEEKLMPHYASYFDSFEFLMNAKSGNKWKTMFSMYKEKGKIQLEAISYIRGRNISNAFVIVDESQNLKPEEIKTILTRVGENTKIIFLGDIEQIDLPGLDAINNGISFLIERFKTSKLSGHITLTQGQRSNLATEAAKLL